MENSRTRLEDLSNNQTLFVLNGLQKSHLPNLADSPETVEREAVNFEAVRSLLADLAEASPVMAAEITALLAEHDRQSADRHALADIGLMTGFLTLAGIVSLVFLQMNADDRRAKAPDLETRPDGTRIERNYFSIEKAMEKAKTLVSKEFLETFKKVFDSLN